MKILIQSAVIVDAKSPYHLQSKDILIENGKIQSIEDQLSVEADRIIAEDNLHISPSWFDSQVHFGEPGYEERETITNGLSVAEKSGFGDVALLPSTFPFIDNANLIENLQTKAQNSSVNLHPIGGLTQKGEGKDLAELFDMHQSGAIAFCDDLQPITNPNLLKIALQYTQNFGGLVCSFPLEKNIMGNAQVHESIESTYLGLKSAPSLSEELQVARDLFILEYTGGKLHIPLIASKKSVELIREAKLKGLNVSCSTSVHHLFFSVDALEEFDSKYKVFPPLRDKTDAQTLIEGIKDGTIDMVTSDHRPMNQETKKMEFEQAAYGTIGLESAFPALNQLLGTELSVQVLTNGKSVFGIASNSIVENELANLTLFNPTEEFEFSENNLYSASKNSIFVGEKLKGKVIELLTA